MSNAIDQFVSVSSNPYGGTQDANELIVRALAFEQSWYDDQGKRVQPDRNAALGVSGLHSQLQSSLHIGLSTPSDSSVNIKDLLLNAQALYRTEEFDLYLAENSGMEEVFVVDHKHPQKRWQVIRTSNLHGLSQLLNILPLGLIQMNNLWQANFVNAQATALTGLQTDELQDRGWMSLFSSEQLSEVRRHFAADFDYVDSFTLTLSYKSPLGRHRVFKAVFSVQGFASHAVRNYVLLLVDVTSEEMVSEQLRHVALHDGMTGLMNRVAFIEHLHAMPVEQLEKGLMVFLDVNNFKFINDHHGHTAGDETLKIIGRRLRKAMRPGDLLSRFGGDEFVLFFEGVESQINASIIAHKLDYIANGPVGIADLQIEVTVSAGFALGSAIPFNSIENTSSESLVEAMLSAADSAMYRAKNNSSAGFFIFDQSLEQERKRRDEQLIELNRLTAESAFDYWFQPIVQDNQLVSVEVLARPQGMVSHLNVLEFFDTARRSRYKSRLFEDLTWGGLQKYQLLRDQWLEFGISSPVPKLNINMDMLQLDSPDLVANLLNMVKHLNLEPENIYVELTEAVLEVSEVKVLDNVQSMRNAGFLVSMDDFGTGFSSLKRLIQYEFDQIKIDKFFFEEMEEKEKNRKTINTIVALGHSLNLEILAEGVETKAQHELLTSYGIDLYQGYYYAKPMPLEELLNQYQGDFKNGGQRSG